MSNYKLYMGGYRGIQGVVIAESKEEAEAELYDRLNLGSLPCELEEIETYGYEIVERQIIPLGAPKPAINTKHRTKPKK